MSRSEREGAGFKRRSALALLIAAILLAAASATVMAQVVDRSTGGGNLTSKIDSALRQAGSAEAGSSFYIIFGFDGLVPSDAEAGASGALMVQRYDGWSISSSSGLMPTTDPWDRMGGDERLLNLASMSMVTPPAEPTLVQRPLLAFLRGKVTTGGQVVLDDAGIRFASGAIRLRDRQAFWLGAASDSNVRGWIGSALELPAEAATTGFHRDLVGLLSVQPGNQVLSRLEAIATGDEDKNARHRAISYLARRSEDTGRILNRILDNADEADDRAEALEALADRLGPASKDRLISAARDQEEPEGVRARAISYLSRIEGRDVDSALERLLSDPDPRMRARVIQAWERREPQRAVPLLERVARTDEEDRARQQAVQSLGDIEGDLASAALGRLFDVREDERVRRRAMEELVSRKTDDRVSWLAGLALTDPSIEIRKQAIRQLGRMKDNEEARRALKRLLNVGR